MRSTNTDTHTDARKVKSRKALNDTLLLLLEETPFNDITIREITNRAGIGYATFFRHYATKEELLNHVAAGQISSLLQLTAPVFYEKNSGESCRLLCQYVQSRGKLWHSLLNGGAASIVRAEFIRQATELTKASPQQSSWLPADLGTRHGTGATIDLLSWWLDQPDGAYSAEMVGDIMDRLIIRPTVSKTPPYSD